MLRSMLFSYSLFNCLIFCGTTAHGAIYFADEFNGPAFNANLVDIDGTYRFSGGTVGNSSSQRAYVRTLENNYMSVDFQADLIYRISGSGGAPGVFFGIGRSTKDASFFNEPESALYLLDHTNGFPFWPASNIVVRRNSPGPAGISDVFNMPFPDGAAYTRITKIGDSMTFAFDHQYNGSSFVPDGSFTLSLSTVAPFLATGPSYLFFGTGFDAVSPSRFDSIRVTAIPHAVVPEAASLVVWLALCGLGIVLLSLREHIRVQ